MRGGVGRIFCRVLFVFGLRFGGVCRRYYVGVDCFSVDWFWIRRGFVFFRIRSFVVEVGGLK